MVDADRVNDFLTRVVPFGCSGTVLLAHEGRVILEQGYGLADRAAGEACTPQTVFSLGSITKQFTAVTVMKLVEQGRLRTEDSIATYLPGVPEDKRGITLHHLLTHTAGVINYTGRDYEAAGRDETVARIFEAPLDFAPGSEFEYSNAGFTLLAAIIETVSGMAYEDFLSRHLFEPAGMRWTGYRRPSWDERTVARWYAGDVDNGIPLDKPYPSWNLMGNGDMLSTTGDMFRWYLALKSGSVLSEAATARLLTPFLSDYAYGTHVDKTERGRCVGHSGSSSLGTSAEFQWFTDHDLLLIIFCNQQPGQLTLAGRIKRKVTALIFGDEQVAMPPAVDPAAIADLRRLEGTYHLPGGDQLRAEVRSSCLVVGATGQGAVNALCFRDPALHVFLHDLNRRAARVVDASLAGDSAALVDAARPVDIERLEERAAFIRRRVGPQGAGAIRALGTVQSQFFKEAFDSYVEVAGPDGESTYVIIIWRDGSLAAAGAVGLDTLEVVAMPFVPVTSTRLAGYHLETGTVAEAGIRLAADGSPVALSFEVPGGDVVLLATRNSADGRGR